MSRATDITNVAIVGAGVAGSYLAFHLARAGFDVDVYEPTKFYNYPCGEAVPEEACAQCIELYSYSKHRIREVIIVVHDEGKVVTHSFWWVRGHVIDKFEFVNDMRRMARGRGASFLKTAISRNGVDHLKRYYDLVIVASGPFVGFVEPVEKIIAFQGFTNDVRSMDDAITMVFRKDVMGYFWVFPSSRPSHRANVGFGCVGCGKARGVLETFLAFARKLGIHRIDMIKGKPIAIVDPMDPRLVRDENVVYVGEAGGFLVPFTGEGIRPALESARHVIHEVEWREFGSVNEALKHLRKVYAKHFKIYRLLRRIGPRLAVKVLTKLSTDELSKMLVGKVSLARLVLKLLL